MGKSKRFIAFVLAGVLTVTSAPVTSTAAVKNGWASNNTVYYKNGKKVTGFQKIDKKYYYFDSKGKMVTSTWKTINGKKYYFRKAGYAATGLVMIGKKYYCFNSNGVMLQATWKVINKSKYYFRKAGYAATGLVKIGKYYYLFKSNGKLYATGLVKYNKKMYLLSKGRVLIGLQKYKGKLYYGTAKGLKTGWVTIKGKKYYFRKAGYAAATGNLTINGKKYTFNSSGVLTSSSASATNTGTTSVKLNKSSASIQMHDALELSATVKTAGSQAGTATWKVSDNKVLSLKKKDNTHVTVTPLMEGTATVTVSVGSVSSTCKITVKPYSYKITPLLAPFNSYFYVETDDPDPDDIRFVDKSSIYYTATDTKLSTLQPTEYRFLDVKYEDKKTGKVAGGYIFSIQNYGLDGGILTLQRASQESSDWDKTYTDTSITVSCPAVKPSDQYLVDTYTTKSASLFDNLDAVEAALDRLAVYPRGVVDTSKINKVMPYPFLAASPYAELSLNTHIEMYPDSEEYLLISSLYPFVLSSLGFPSMIASVAQILDPSCEVKWGSMHYLVDVTKNGETHSYGGAGTGTYNPLYASHIQTQFTFDKSEGDYAFSASLDKLAQKRQEYSEAADNDAKGNLDKISGDTYKRTVAKGNWIRVGVEGWWSSGNEVMADTYRTAYAYVTQGNIIQDPSQNDIYISSVEDVWVDGRYIDKWNRFEKGAKFSDYPTANILVRGMTYTNCRGNVYTGDVIYRYDSASDTWRSDAYYYIGSHTILASNEPLPDEFILTRAEVEAMKLDRNTDKDPETGYIYDGTVEPGTPFKN